MGLGGPGADLRLSWGGLGRAFGLGSIREDRFFSELIFSAKNNPRKICKLF
jgi:hypothetical protein